jgi:hypothetical protein
MSKSVSADARSWVRGAGPEFIDARFGHVARVEVAELAFLRATTGSPGLINDDPRTAFSPFPRG